MATEVFYDMTEERAEAFRRDFTHLYHRIRRLEDGVTACWLTGDAHAFVRARLPRAGLPFFASVSFDAAAAEKFERRVEKALGGGYTRAAARMPSPAFPVRVTADLYGTREEFVYAFGGEDAFVAFCKEVCARAQACFRHRFAAKEAPHPGGKYVKIAPPEGER